MKRQITINGRRTEIAGHVRLVAQLPIPAGQQVYRLTSAGTAPVPLTDPIRPDDRFITRPAAPGR